jgi:hypothetical protein
MFAILLLQVGIGDLISGIPRDAGAVVVYIVLAIFIGFVWIGSRPGASRSGPRSGRDSITSTKSGIDGSRR